MAKLYDVISPAGSYTDKNGQEKTRWIKHGVVIDKGAGKPPSLKMDSYAVGGDGWYTLAEPRQPHEEAAAVSGRMSRADYMRQTGGEPKQVAEVVDDFNDDIPY